jgi:hypothetical protein
MFVSTVGHFLRSTAATAFQIQCQRSYHALEAQRTRVLDVTALIERVAPTVVARFTVAQRGVEDWQTGTNQPSGTAVNIRTLIEGIRGEWWDEIRQPSEQKLKWVKVVDRMLPRTPDAIEELTRQDAVYDELHENLTNVAKLIPSTPASIGEYWRVALDYAFVILTLLEGHRAARQDAS